MNGLDSLPLDADEAGHFVGLPFRELPCSLQRGQLVSVVGDVVPDEHRVVSWPVTRMAID